MRSRLAAIALLIAVGVGVVQLLRSETGHALVGRLDRWYDARHGIGNPCDDRVAVPYRGSYGVTLYVPRCWQVTPGDTGGIPTATMLDPGLHQSFTLRFVRRDDAEAWAKATRSVELRERSPMASVETLQGWRIVRCVMQQPGSRLPQRSYEWAAVTDRVIVLVVFEMHKFYVDLSGVTDFVDTINAVVHSIRLEDESAGPVTSLPAGDAPR